MVGQPTVYSLGRMFHRTDATLVSRPPHDTAWLILTSVRVAFIYSCPSTSPIKARMVYSTGAVVIHRQVRELLGEERGFALASRKIETSDPRELTEAFLKEELNIGNGTDNGKDTNSVTRTSFARPKGPGRRR